jgi:hypothetical protein
MTTRKIGVHSTGRCDNLSEEIGECLEVVGFLRTETGIPEGGYQRVYISKFRTHSET